MSSTDFRLLIYSLSAPFLQRFTDVGQRHRLFNELLPIHLFGHNYITIIFQAFTRFISFNGDLIVKYNYLFNIYFASQRESVTIHDASVSYDRR